MLYMYACINKKKQGSYLYRVIKNYLRSICLNFLKKNDHHQNYFLCKPSLL